METLLSEWFAGPGGETCFVRLLLIVKRNALETLFHRVLGFARTGLIFTGLQEGAQPGGRG